MGEEDASDSHAASSLSPSSPTAATTKENKSGALRARVVELTDDVLAQPPLPSPASSDAGADADANSGIGGGGGRWAKWGLGRQWGTEALLKAVDRGNHAGGRTGRTYE